MTQNKKVRKTKQAGVRQSDEESPLTSVRVLDLTDAKGFLCGRILADLGADVIKIERPEGDHSRNTGASSCDIPLPEDVLCWFGFNLNKRGITLNIEATEGQEIFKRLVRRADIVLESFPPGHMDSLSLGYAALSKVNPRIIVTSITPFGQNGPYRNYKAPDIVIMAMSGYMYLCGDPDRAPVRISFPHAYLHAAAEAAVGTLMAYYHCQVMGEGQHVDVSAHEAMTWATMTAPLFWEFSGMNLQRVGPYRVGFATGAKQLLIWSCKDGYVAWNIAGGRMGARSNRNLVRWLEYEGMAPDFLKNVNWDTLDFTSVTTEEFQRLGEPIGKFLMRYTKWELYRSAIERHIVLYPVFTIEDILNDPQLIERDFWVKVEQPDLNDVITYPGAFAKLSKTPCMVRRYAPLIGEHNEEIYVGELGFTKQDLDTFRHKGII
jgi:crotonobetainyl-CoA:carnitine CoA-transferase CaiB-like acyl-CoA transferase